MFCVLFSGEGARLSFLEMRSKWTGQEVEWMVERATGVSRACKCVGEDGHEIWLSRLPVRQLLGLLCVKSSRLGERGS